MLECRRIINGVPLAGWLQEAATLPSRSFYLEAWSRDGWHCPFCAGIVHPGEFHPQLSDDCPHCKGVYWSRLVEGDTFVTSGDDPVKRPGGG